MSSTNASTVAKSHKAKRNTPPRNTPTKPVVSVPSSIPPETRRQMIAEAAYYIAEHRGFCGGNPDSDWIHAEQEIDRILGLQ